MRPLFLTSEGNHAREYDYENDKISKLMKDKNKKVDSEVPKTYSTLPPPPPPKKDHKGFHLLFTNKTLGHQVGPPTSRQYVATTWEKISELIDWIGGELAALPLVMQHGDCKQHKKTLVTILLRH